MGYCKNQSDKQDYLLQNHDKMFMWLIVLNRDHVTIHVPGLVPNIRIYFRELFILKEY